MIALFVRLQRGKVSETVSLGIRVFVVVVFDFLVSVALRLVPEVKLAFDADLRLKESRGTSASSIFRGFHRRSSFRTFGEFLLVQLEFELMNAFVVIEFETRTLKVDRAIVAAKISLICVSGYEI